jgi:hypothetical protein
VTVRAGPRLPSVQPEAISRGMETTSKWRWVQGHWEAFRPRLAAYWSRLPEEDVERLSGDRPSLVLLVKRHYALQQSGAEAQVDAWLAGLSTDSPPPARTTDEQRAEGEGMGSVPGAVSPGNS